MSGGPVGIEGSVGAGGPLLAVIGFMVFPLLWSVPEALLTAELACAFPENSGYVYSTSACLSLHALFAKLKRIGLALTHVLMSIRTVNRYVAWVSAAFGNRVGYMEGALSWLSGVADNSVYPLLFLEYLSDLQVVNLSDTSKWLAATGLCLVLSYLNWRGLHIVGRTAVGLCIFSLLPFIVLVVYGAPKVDLQRFQQPNLGDVDWGYLLNVLFWNLNYWDSISTLAGEVSRPEKTFPTAVGCVCNSIASCFLHAS